MADVQLSEHFWLSEVACPCGCAMPSDVRGEVELTVKHAERIRAAIGCPMTVTSGYRCHEYNRAGMVDASGRRIKGAKFSQHLFGRALDVITVHRGAFVGGVARGIMFSGGIPNGGIGLYASYPNMAHIDFRGRFTMWTKG